MLLLLKVKPIGKFVLQGEGAGPGPTTSALVSDICSVLEVILNTLFQCLTF